MSVGGSDDNESTNTKLSRKDNQMSKKDNMLSACCCGPLVERWVSFTNTLRRGITNGVLRTTHHAATHPWAYVGGITFFSLALLGIGFATNFNMQVTAFEQYTVFDSVMREEKQWVDDIVQFPPTPHSVRMMIHAHGASVLTQQGIQHAFDVVQEIQASPYYDEVCPPTNHVMDHRQFTYEDNKTTITNGGGYGSECHIRGITMLWNNSQSLMKNKTQSDKDILKAVASAHFPDGSDVDTREIMGRVTRHNGHKKAAIESAESILMEFMIPATHEKASVLEGIVLDRLLELRKQWTTETLTDENDDKFALEVFIVSYLEKETTRAVMKDLPLTAIVFVIMAVFTCVVFSSNGSAKNSQTASSSHYLLGVGAVLCVGLSLATSYGLGYIIGKS